jgi:uncharacterized protein DUF2721
MLKVFADSVTLASAMAVLTAMITPALLIMASGTFILSTSNRLGRVVDRVRTISDTMEAMMAHEAETQLIDERRTMLFEQMDRLSVRATLLQSCLTVFYLASAVFVATSVALGILAIAGSHFSWVPVVMGICGALCLLYGSVLLIYEARLAVTSVRSEMSFLRHLVEHHREEGQRRGGLRS